MRQHFYRGLFGLQFRTTVLLTGVVLAATGLTGATYLRLSQQTTLRQCKMHASALARTLAVGGARAVPLEDRQRLLAIVEDAVPDTDLCYVVFTDMGGRILASQQRCPGTVNQIILRDKDHISVEPIDQGRVMTDGAGQEWIDVVYPVPAYFDGSPMGGAAGHRPTTGYVRLGLSLRVPGQALDAMSRHIIGLAVGIALLMVPLGYEIVRYLVKPINQLSEAAAGLAMGKLETRVAGARRDEIGELSRSFNAMADTLSASHHQLTQQSAELEQRVRQRTNDLEKVNRQLREMASRDSLTGLYNRRHFNEILSQLFAEAERYGKELTCMMMDLDNFKRVNDTLGHQMGDQLLELTARVITGSIRESDVAVRYGGDEFAVLLPQTSPNDARVSAERLLTRFRAEIARSLPEASIVSLSIGLASREQDQPGSAKELLNLSDEALYLAKAGGKDRIMVLRPGQLAGNAA
ncbi:MAG TPA: diguanylate cyclase [Phycisphaerae bacterium]|nr:diguanylate cyclase [Phycisphaerae bacterium]